METMVASHRELFTETLATFINSHDDIPAVILLNINRLGLRDALLQNSNHTVFNHLFVKNYSQEERAVLENMFVTRLEKYGAAVFTTLLAFIQNSIQSLDKASIPILSIFQFLEGVYHTNRKPFNLPTTVFQELLVKLKSMIIRLIIIIIIITEIEIIIE